MTPLPPTLPMLKDISLSTYAMGFPLMCSNYMLCRKLLLLPLQSKRRYFWRWELVVPLHDLVFFTFFKTTKKKQLSFILSQILLFIPSYA